MPLRILPYWTHCRLIRLSSRNLNYIIGLGAITIYLNVITLVIPTTNPHFAAVLCNASENQQLIRIANSGVFETDQSLALISWLFSLFWYCHYEDGQSMGHFQQPF